MNENNQKIGYIVYTRKSTEGDEKQALSIDSQREKAMEIFPDLRIVDVVEEKKSAFTPYNRPVFAEMLTRIKRGEAQGIIAWHPDRLSRNEIDGGLITFMLRQKEILDLKFCSYTFDNSPEGIMFLQLALSQSQYSSAKLSKDVKRGLEKKLKMGWLPGVAPSGYLNNKLAQKGEKEILVDPNRFPLIRKAWDLLLTGSYTVPQILYKLNHEWGYRTIKRTKEGGNPMSRSALYKIFTNSFYAGPFEYSGKIYQGKHDPMITLEEFDHAQIILGRSGKPRPQKYSFSFSGTFRCAECGCLYVAEKKHKVIKGTGEVRSYIYYHCSHSKPNYRCSQRSSITQERLELLVSTELENWTILPEFRQWAVDALSSSHKKEVEARSKIYETLHKELVSLQSKEDKLIDMRCSGLIDDDKYTERAAEMQKRKKEVQELLRDTENRADKWVALTEKTFDFVTYALQSFVSGDAQIKKEIILALSSNQKIKDGKLFVSANKWLQPIGNSYPALKEEYLTLEPLETVSNKAKTEALDALRLRWLPIVDVFRRLGQRKMEESFAILEMNFAQYAI
ncbi:MAG TPA: recombinase family protein [Patescibacteria group bacterium]